MTGKEQLIAVTAGLHFVEIDGSGVEQGRTYTEKATGLTKPLQGRQTGFLWQGDRYPVQIAVNIPDGKPPYRPGLYVMSGGIFEAGKFNRVEFRGTREMQLIPLPDAIDALKELQASEDASTAPAKIKAA